MHRTYRRQSSNRSRRRRLALRTLAHAITSRSDPSSDSELEPVDQSVHHHHQTFQMPSHRIEDSFPVILEDAHTSEELSSNEFSTDESLPLFVNSTFTTNQATVLLMEFTISAHLDKQRTDKLLRMVKALLPRPNNLPKRHSKVLEHFGTSTLFSTRYLCLHCNNPLIKSAVGRHQRTCSNVRCSSSRSIVRSNETTEIATLDIRSSLSSIISRNIRLFEGHHELFPRSDPTNFGMYRRHQQMLQSKTNVSESQRKWLRGSHLQISTLSIRSRILLLGLSTRSH